ncbi:mitogen-activated protein kinase kinase kinase YODA-like [Amaranthus tricolor]|uniref:mitogen-activated protein kinase kinase kinase YODA-like n=1 Tax=Amaranthus tricolor TaxID=29722 RepID=UPI0025894C79|nr:mitogen-activated protein kinase kinase kinase YODA-like [Amaranthus tricolor]XP_057527940.1 mitogen-activated protein kinase kinase kinase YODA-like [Amaranthus tricolor]
MPSWWGKSSSKEAKKKTGDETILDTLRRKFRSPSDVKLDSSSGASRRHCIDTVSERGAQSRAESRSPSPSKDSKRVGRCQSFVERPLAQPLPLPGLHPANVSRTDSGISLTSKPRLEKSSKSSLFRPLPRPSCIRSTADHSELDNDLVTASVSSNSSVESDDLTDSRLRSPQASDLDIGPRTAAGSPSSVMLKDNSPKSAQNNSIEALRPGSIPLSKQNTTASTRRRPLGNHVPNLQVPAHGAFYSAPDSSMSSPSRSPIRTPNSEQVLNTAFWASKPYPDVTLLGSGHCSSPGSGHNSGHNSMGGDISGQLFWQQPSRGSPEHSPIPSPRMTSPGPSSRVQSGAVTPIHPRAAASGSETHASWGDDGKQQSHRLPLPPVAIPSPSPFSHGNSAATSPSVPRSPARGDNLPSPTLRWKKGRLLGRGTFGHVYLGFNSETGEMCAMKEVTLFSDDPKSKESAKQLQQEISLLSRLRHPNIVQYYGSETVGDKLYIYLEFVSGGSIYKLLQEYGQLGELAIRSYTQQILSGLAYLHGKKTVHRDIKGANILVDPNGRVKLADFGMAKHITGQSCPLSLKGSPYWMAPEVIKNSNGCNLAVDIWSLGCTVLEMATTKPPWSQYEGVAAMFKIGNSKELPAIPDHLSEEGKDFVRLCLQRNPYHRRTAAKLLEHPFVKNTAPLERPLPTPEPADSTSLPNGMRNLGVGFERNLSGLDSERLAVHSSRVSPARPRSSEYHIPRNISCPVSPIGSPLLHSRSPQHLNGMMSPSPISSPRATSGSSTPLTGGSGAIPFHLSQQSLYMQDGFGAMPKSPNSVFLNGPCYHDHNPNILRGMQSGPRAMMTPVSSESEIRVKQIERERPYQGGPCNGRALLADRVSQQLLREQVKLNPSVEFSPRSTLPSRTHGL